ncbi:MAG: hypothetical protein R3B84_21550 [Zavarzinella sp.]
MRLLSLMLLVLLAGCSGNSNQPEFGILHPVSGTITLGGNPVKGGTIQLNLEPDNTEFLINSEVSDSGKFELTTVRTTDSSGERKKGVAPGTYKVTYLPNLNDQTAGYREPVVLPKPVVIEAKENILSLELPLKPSR